MCHQWYVSTELITLRNVTLTAILMRLNNEVRCDMRIKTNENRFHSNNRHEPNDVSWQERADGCSIEIMQWDAVRVCARYFPHPHSQQNIPQTMRERGILKSLIKERCPPTHWTNDFDDDVHLQIIIEIPPVFCIPNFTLSSYNFYVVVKCMQL